jgi:hypothetical protein
MNLTLCAPVCLLEAYMSHRKELSFLLLDAVWLSSLWSTCGVWRLIMRAVFLGLLLAALLQLSSCWYNADGLVDELSVSFNGPVCL